MPTSSSSCAHSAAWVGCDRNAPWTNVSTSWRWSSVASSASTVGWVRSTLMNSTLPPGSERGRPDVEREHLAVARVLLEAPQQLPSEIRAGPGDRDDAAGAWGLQAAWQAYSAKEIRGAWYPVSAMVEPVIRVLPADVIDQIAAGRGDRAPGLGGQGAGRQRDRRRGAHDHGRDLGRRPRVDPGHRRRPGDVRGRCGARARAPRDLQAPLRVDDLWGLDQPWGSGARRCRRSRACRG